jgi:EpsI family protein
MSGARLGAVGVTLAVFGLLVTWHAQSLQALPSSTLAALPLSLGAWTGREDPPLEPGVADVLRADEYLMRTYRNRERSDPPVGLYVAFYASQQTGATIHSPLNCLPGAGWDPIERGRTTLALPGGRAVVNRYIVQKGTDRQAVFYWFQSRGRVVASEYTSRLLLVRDAFTTGRGDGALVRLTVPIRDRAADADLAAARFAEQLQPALLRHLPM